MEQTPASNNIPEDMGSMPALDADITQPNAPAQADDTQPNSPKSGGMGPMIGIIIIVALLAVGGLYYWGSKLIEQPSSFTAPVPDNLRPVDPITIDGTTNDLLNQGSSDTVEAIEADLDATNLDGLDGELSDIEAVLDEAL
jgi:hypothetical protein